MTLFRRTDRRPNRGIMAHGNKSISGVRAMTSVLPGLAHDPAYTTTAMRLQADDSKRAAAESDEEGDDHDDAAGDPAGLECKPNRYLGWRTTYRLTEPEKPNKAKIAKRLTTTMNSFKHVLMKIPTAPRLYRAMNDKSKRSDRSKAKGKAHRIMMHARRIAFKAASEAEHGTD